MSDGIEVKQQVTINQPAEELFRFWRNFENLPQFMRHLESVSVLDDKRSHWVAKAPLGNVEWDAEIVEEEPSRRIVWRSAENAEVANAGSVLFLPGPAERGTEVYVVIEYAPPVGVVGATVAKLFGEEPNQQVKEDLLRFKQLMEAGEIATNEGQPHGKRSIVGKILSPNS